MTNHPLKTLIADYSLLNELAENFGTPLYVYSSERLSTNLNRLNQALADNFDRYHICYAVKANSNPHLLKLLHRTLPAIGSDCASPGEIYAARLAGIDPAHSIYTGNYESNEDLKYALENGISINLDDSTSLARLARIGLPGRISFRLNPGFGRGMFPHITTGGEKAKFGVPRDKIAAVYQQAVEMGIHRFGLQCMTGSGVLDPDYFTELLTAILEAAREVEAVTGKTMEYISIGGGIGIPYRDEESPIPIDQLMSSLAKIFFSYYNRNDDNCPALWLEPGKYIIGDAGFILSRVTGLKNSYRKFVGLDAGMETILRPSLYSAYHRFLKVGYPDDEPAGKVDFTGRICENTDRQAIDRPFPAVEEGDLVAIMDAGAYGFAMASQYNSRPRPAEILLTNGQAKVIRRREDLADIYRNCDLE